LHYDYAPIKGSEGIKMRRPVDYEEFADECVRLADTAKLPEHRVMLMHIAETWRRLADDSRAKAAKANGGLGDQEATQA
jgi:hypothetical protein